MWRFICFLHSIVSDLNGPIVSAGRTIWVKPPVVAQEGATPEAIGDTALGQSS
jgi:hypothetical protein